MIGNRKKITLQQWTSTPTATGSTETLSNSYVRYADIKRISGNRGLLNGQVSLSNYFSFKIRFEHFTPTSNWVIVYDSRNFKIHSIEAIDQRNFYWNIIGEAQQKR